MYILIVEKVYLYGFSMDSDIILSLKEYLNPDEHIRLLKMNKSYLHLFTCLFVLLCWSVPSAQIPHIDLNQYSKVNSTYNIEWVDLKHTSPGGAYDSMIQDSLGFIWIASDEGLHVYDGAKTIRYGNAQSKYSLDDRFENWSCKYIHYSPKSHLIYLILIEEKALISIDPYTRELKNVIYHSEEKFRGLCCVDEYEDGIVFVTRLSPDYTIVLSPFEGEQSIIYTDTTMRVDPKFRINELQVDNKGIHLLRTNGQIVIDDKGNEIDNFRKFTSYPRNSTTKNVVIKKLDQNEDASRYCNFGFMSVAADYNKLYLLDEDRQKYQNLSEELIDVKKTYAKNNLSIEFKQFYKERNKENVFALTHKNIYRIKRKAPDLEKFYVPFHEGGADISIRQATKDSGGDIYVSYYGGIAKLDTANTILEPLSIKYPDQRKMHVSYSLSQYKDHLYWNNIQVDKDGKAQPLFGDLRYGHVMSFIQNDSLVVLPWDGNHIHIYDIGIDSAFVTPIDSIVYAEFGSRLVEISCYLKTENNDEIWIGTAFDGIKKINLQGKYIDGFTKKSFFADLPGNSIFDMQYVSDGIACAGHGGIYFVDTLSRNITIKRFQYVDKYGLITNRDIYNIEKIDELNWLLGTDRGLILFNLDNGKYTELQKDHPLSTIEFNRNASFKHGNYFYFGTTTGLYRFKLQELEWLDYRKEKQEVKILAAKATTAKSKTKALNSTFKNEFTIEPNSTNIELEFSYSSFQQDVYYSYNITGNEQDWSRYTTDNTFNIYSLPAGNHNLGVRISKNLTDADVVISHFKFFVKTAWYLSWWAYLIYILVIGLLLYAFYRYRINQLLLYQRLRTKISSDLHDDVGSLLTAVAMQSELLSLKSSEAERSKFNKLSTLSREAMGRMRDTVWAIDSRMDNVDSLIGRMKDFVADVDEASGFKVYFSDKIENATKKMAPDVRQGIYLVFKEALNNALKHSNGDTIKINLSQNDKNYQLVVHDNGKIDADKVKSSGLGLKNMKMRANRLGGSLQIDFTDGCKVELLA